MRVVNTKQYRDIKEQLNRHLFNRFPVLIEGPTGSGKTFVALDVLGPDVIRFNCNSDTSVDQLLGTSVIGEYEGEITFKEGAFYKAFVNGKPLLIDEINLADEQVLSFMSVALNTKEIFVDDQINGSKRGIMHDNFKIVATMNSYSVVNRSTRRPFSPEFLSNFEIIKTYELSFEIQKEIIANLFENNKNFSIIQQFFDELSANVNNETFFPTVRDAIGVFRSIETGFSLYDSILMSYGAIPKDVLINICKKLDICKPEYEMAEIDEKNYLNNKISNRVFSLAKNRLLQIVSPIMIRGKRNCGKSYLSQLIGKNLGYGNPRIICGTPETTLSDFIGKYGPVSKEMKIPLIWNNGPLIQSMIDGRPVIIDHIEMIPSHIIEGLNGLLDSLNSFDGEKIAQFYELPHNDLFCINRNFRIIANACVEEIHNLSPALLDRFTIIDLDDQFSSFEKDELKSVVNRLIHMDFEPKLFSDIASLSKFIHIVQNLFEKYPDFKTQINDFAKGIFATPLRLDIDKSFAEEVLGSIQEQSFFMFKSILSLEKYMAGVYLLYQCGLPIVIEGRTGIGKTSSIMSLMNHIENSQFIVQMNRDTSVMELIGNYVMENNQFVFKSGPLLKCFIEGGIFLGDEFDLLDSSSMISMWPFIDYNCSCEIYLPGDVDGRFRSNSFMFVSCQNGITMKGRSGIPESISGKLFKIDYPNLREQEFGKMMMGLAKNHSKSFEISTIQIYSKLLSNQIHFGLDFEWNFRSTIRLIKRCAYSQNKNFKGFDIYTHIALLMLSQAEYTEKSKNSIIEYFKNVIHYDISGKLEELFEFKTEYRIEGNEIFLNRGLYSVSIIIPNLSSVHLLDSFVESLFSFAIIPPDEPVLFYGPSSFKHTICKLVLPGSLSYSLQSDTTVSTLIGEAQLLNLHDSILQLGLIQKECIDEENIFGYNIKGHIQNKIDILNLTSNNYVMKYESIFVPGVVTKAILSQIPIAISSFDNSKVAVIERLNGILSYSPELTLVEDYCHTILPEGIPSIKIGNNGFRLCGIITKNPKRCLSDAMISRFNIIRVNEYDSNQLIEMSKKFGCPIPIKDIDHYRIVNSVFLQCKRFGKINEFREIIKMFFEKKNSSSMIEDYLDISETSIISKSSGISMKFSNLYQNEVVWNAKRANLAEFVFVCSQICQPLIIHGSKCSGRKHIIKYVYSILGIKPYIISITKSTKPTDLFGENKVVINNGNPEYKYIKTEFVNMLENEEGESPYWIILDDIDLASPELISSLRTVFDSSCIDFELPNGNLMRKGDFFVVGLTQSISHEFLDKYSINYLLPECSDDEKLRIGKEIIDSYRGKSFAIEYSLAYTIIDQLYEYTFNVQGFGINFNELCTLLNSIASTPSFHCVHLCKILLSRLFNNHDVANKVTEILNSLQISNDTICPKISLSSSSISLNGNYFPVEDPSCYESLKYLTVDQIDLLYTIGLLKFIRSPLIVKGNVFSGKKYPIKLFCQITGIKLEFLQLNSSTDKSLFIGGLRPNINISAKIKNDIIQRINEVDNEFGNILLSKEHWTTDDIHDIQSRLNSSDADELLKELHSSSYLNTLSYHQSPVETAMDKNKWILIDGIELCSVEVLDSLNELLQKGIKSPVIIIQREKDVPPALKSEFFLNFLMKSFDETLNNCACIYSHIFKSDNKENLHSMSIEFATNFINVRMQNSESRNINGRVLYRFLSDIFVQKKNNVENEFQKRFGSKYEKPKGIKDDLKLFESHLACINITQISIISIMYKITDEMISKSQNYARIFETLLVLEYVHFPIYNDYLKKCIQTYGKAEELPILKRFSLFILKVLQNITQNIIIPKESKNLSDNNFRSDDLIRRKTLTNYFFAVLSHQRCRNDLDFDINIDSPVLTVSIDSLPYPFLFLAPFSTEPSKFTTIGLIHICTLDLFNQNRVDVIREWIDLIPKLSMDLRDSQNFVKESRFRQRIATFGKNYFSKSLLNFICLDLKKELMSMKHNTFVLFNFDSLFTGFDSTQGFYYWLHALLIYSKRIGNGDDIISAKMEFVFNMIQHNEFITHNQIVNFFDQFTGNKRIVRDDKLIYTLSLVKFDPMMEIVLPSYCFEDFRSICNNEMMVKKFGGYEKMVNSDNSSLISFIKNLKNEGKEKELFSPKFLLKDNQANSLPLLALLYNPEHRFIFQQFVNMNRISYAFFVYLVYSKYEFSLQYDGLTGSLKIQKYLTSFIENAVNECIIYEPKVLLSMLQFQASNSMIDDGMILNQSLRKILSLYDCFIMKIDDYETNYLLQPIGDLISNLFMSSDRVEFRHKFMLDPYNTFKQVIIQHSQKLQKEYIYPKNLLISINNLYFTIRKDLWINYHVHTLAKSSTYNPNKHSDLEFLVFKNWTFLGNYLFHLLNIQENDEERISVLINYLREVVPLKIRSNGGEKKLSSPLFNTICKRQHFKVAKFLEKGEYQICIQNRSIIEIISKKNSWKLYKDFEEGCFFGDSTKVFDVYCSIDYESSITYDQSKPVTHYIQIFEDSLETLAGFLINNGIDGVSIENNVTINQKPINIYFDDLSRKVGNIVDSIDLAHFSSFSIKSENSRFVFDNSKDYSNIILDQIKDMKKNNVTIKNVQDIEELIQKKLDLSGYDSIKFVKMSKTLPFISNSTSKSTISIKKALYSKKLSAGIMVLRLYSYENLSSINENDISTKGILSYIKYDYYIEIAIVKTSNAQIQIKDYCIKINGQIIDSNPYIKILSCHRLDQNENKIQVNDVFKDDVLHFSVSLIPNNCHDAPQITSNCILLSKSKESLSFTTESKFGMGISKSLYSEFDISEFVERVHQIDGFFDGKHFILFFASEFNYPNDSLNVFISTDSSIIKIENPYCVVPITKKFFTYRWEFIVHCDQVFSQNFKINVKIWCNQRIQNFSKIFAFGLIQPKSINFDEKFQVFQTGFLNSVKKENRCDLSEHSINLSPKILKYYYHNGSIKEDIVVENNDYSFEGFENTFQNLYDNEDILEQYRKIALLIIAGDQRYIDLLEKLKEYMSSFWIEAFNELLNEKNENSRNIIDFIPKSIVQYEMEFKTPNFNLPKGTIMLDISEPPIEKEQPIYKQFKKQKDNPVSIFDSTDLDVINYLKESDNLHNRLSCSSGNESIDLTMEISDLAHDSVKKTIFNSIKSASMIMKNLGESITRGLYSNEQEVILLYDISSTIGRETGHRYLFNALEAVSLSMDNLSIPFSIFVFANFGFLFRLKKTEEHLQYFHFALLLQAIHDYRQVSCLSYALHRLILENQRNNNIKHNVIIFSDCLFSNIHSRDKKFYDDWQKLIIKKFDSIFTICIQEDDDMHIRYKDFLKKVGIPENHLCCFKKYYEMDANVFASFIKEIISKDSKHSNNSIETIRSINDVFQGNHAYIGKLINPTSVSKVIKESKVVRKSKVFTESNSISPSKMVYDSKKPITFVPNKPTRYSPSEKPGKLYFPGIIKFLLSSGNERKIYQERNCGLVPSYSSIVLIDKSHSCFGFMSNSYSIKIVEELLMSLLLSDNETISIAMSGTNQPIKICDPTPPIILSQNNIINRTISELHNPCYGSGFIDLLNSAEELISKCSSKNVYVFLLSDGQYNSQHIQEIQKIIERLMFSNIKTIGIGIGLNANLISNIISNGIIVEKPSDLTNTLNSKNYQNIAFEERIDNEERVFIIDESIEITDDLLRPLKRIPKFSHGYHLGLENNKIAINRENDDNPIYDLSYNKKWNTGILFCCFYDKTIGKILNYKEQKHISIQTLSSEYGLFRTLENQGFLVKSVNNYYDAMNEMQSGKYCQMWVICSGGPSFMSTLPDGTSGFELIDQFIECTIKFQQLGGSLCWWADNEPLFYEVNCYLSKASFSGLYPSFRVSGNEDGEKTIKAGDISRKSKKTFDERFILEDLGRPSYGFNLGKFFEGSTISSIDVRSNIVPFRPFAISSKGNYLNIYYSAPNDSIEGDVIIDCGFTKLYHHWSVSGTQRLVKNIASWLVGIEKRSSQKSNYDLTRCRKVEKFQFSIDTSSIKPYQMNNVAFTFLVDSTKSMESSIRTAQKITEKIRESKILQKNCEFSAVFFRDKAYAELKKKKVPENKSVVFNFGESIQFNHVKVQGGGGDGPEDWVDAFTLIPPLPNGIDVHIIVLITDSGGHGMQFHQDLPNKDPVYNNFDMVEGQKLEAILHNMAQNGYAIILVQLYDKNRRNNNPVLAIPNSYITIERIFEQYGNHRHILIQEYVNKNLGESITDQAISKVMSGFDRIIQSCQYGNFLELNKPRQ